MAKVIMEGRIDCIMHSSTKKITPSRQTPENAIEEFPKNADVRYSKIWIVLDGSDPENPWWLEIERPVIPSCEWKERGNLQIRSGKRVRVTLELLEKKERTQMTIEVTAESISFVSDKCYMCNNPWKFKVTVEGIEDSLYLCDEHLEKVRKNWKRSIIHVEERT